MLKNTGVADRRELVRWYQDACVRPTGEPLPVADDGKDAATSTSDRTASTSDNGKALPKERHDNPQVFLLSIPETVPSKTSPVAQMRAMIETILFGLMGAATIGMVLKQAFA